MAEALVIVESPAKAKTINKFLGKGYRVEPSMGHVRDLPKKEEGVDVDGDFTPKYVLIGDRKKVIDKLTKVAKSVDRIIVATDPDREGEAIGWHLAEVLKKHSDVPVARVMFNEITKRAVLEALANPTEINQSVVDAQQARRILDRLVGYRLSPLLWDKIRRGLSAGRVQSVALRIVCDREGEIDAFVPVEYWVVSAQLEGAEPPPFTAKLKKKAGKDVELHSADEVKALRADLEGASWKVASVETKERKRTPPPPYTTSKFQQEASRRLRLPVRRAMQLAQSLYEGKEVGGRGAVGLITYMRTDSVRVAETAVAQARDFILAQYDDRYL
ncbi:MAG TPA: DNA topoisomerase, partial [Pseudomonadales bacterium]|nr:DNA topoisomerase [Pseudomonadales bacterium]